MTIPALVLIDRIKTLAESYRARAEEADTKWNELRRQGRPVTEKRFAIRDVNQFNSIADELEKLVEP